jgi:hypothetical protein
MHDPWFGGFTNRKHHLTRLLADQKRLGRCLYVQRKPIPPQLVPEILAATGVINTAAGCLIPVIDGRFHVFAPFEGVDIQAEDITPLLERMNLTDYFLLTQTPLLADLAVALRPVATVYDCTDDYSTILADRKEVVERGDRLLLEQADAVTTVSQALHEQKTRLHQRVLMLPNGVDTEHFAIHDQPIPPDLESWNGRTIAGYVGRINYKFDMALLREVARMRPEIQFILIGPITCDATALARQPNVVLLGIRDYQLLPAYVKRFDLCVIPHLIGAITHFMNPIKAYEYLAMGKPVVSTAIGGLEDIASEVIIAESAAQFSAGIERALEARSVSDTDRRRRLALGHTWNQRADRLSSLFEELTSHPGPTTVAQA